MSHFYALVYITYWQGDSTCNGATGGELLHSTSISTTCAEQFKLMGDFLFLSQRTHVVHHAAVNDDATVINLDSCSLAQLGALFMGSCTGGVIGNSDVQSESKVGLNFQCCCMRTAQAYFFLNGEYCVQVIIGLQLCLAHSANGLNQHVATTTVVDALDVDAVAHFYHIAPAGDGIAYCDPFFHLFLGHAQVNDVIGNGGHFAAFFGAHDVNGLYPHATG